MFCEKCGNKLKDGDKFCEKCGTPVKNAPVHNVPVQNTPVQNVPVQNAPATDSVAPVDYNYESNTSSQSSPVNYESNTNNQPAPVNYESNVNNQAGIPTPEKPKKRVPLVVKILIPVVAVVVAAIIVLVTVILPMFNKVEVKDFVTLNFGEETLYEGYANGTVVIDNDAITEKYLKDKEPSVDMDLNSYLDSIGDGDYGSALKQFGNDLLNSSASVPSITSFCKITATVNSSDKATDSSQDEAIKGSSTAESSDYGSSSAAKVHNLSADDVIKVQITWPTNTSQLKLIEKYESVLGISFDKSSEEFEIKVSDILNEKNLKMETPVTTDVFKYIEDNKLFHTIGITEERLKFEIDDFEYKVGKYNLEYDAEDSEITISDENDIILETIYVRTVVTHDGEDETYRYLLAGYTNGDTATLSIDETQFDEIGLIFESDSKGFKITANTGLTAETAKSNIDKIKTSVTEQIKDMDEDEYGNVNIENMYFTDIKAEDEVYTNAITVIIKGKSYFSDTTKYYSVRFYDSYIDDEGEFESEEAYRGTWTGYEKLKDLMKYDTLLSEKDNTSTKIYG